MKTKNARGRAWRKGREPLEVSQLGEVEGTFQGQPARRETGSGTHWSRMRMVRIVTRDSKNSR